MTSERSTSSIPFCGVVVLCLLSIRVSSFCLISNHDRIIFVTEEMSKRRLLGEEEESGDFTRKRFKTLESTFDSLLF